MKELGRKLLRGAVLLFVLIAAFFSISIPAYAKKKVVLSLANDTFQLETDSAALGDLLNELGIELPEKVLQGSQLTLNSALPGKIALPWLYVYRMSEEEVVPPPIDYRIIPTQSAPRVEVRSSGNPGFKRVNITVFTLDGKIVGGRTTYEMLKEPKARIIHIYREVDKNITPSYETIIRMRRLASREFKPPLRAKKVLTMDATAYSPEEATAGWGNPHNTAIGLRAGYGVVAVDPKVIPLKTRLYIEGYGYAVAGDVGGAIKGMRIDLGFDTQAEALKFGRRDVKVWVLD